MSGCIFTTKRVTIVLLLAVSLLHPATAATRSVWTRAALDGGIVTALAIDPKTPSTLYAGTQVGGIFKSLDGGGSWQAINNGLPEGGICQGCPSPSFPTPPGRHIVALAIDPLTPTTVYVATRAKDIFKSTDGGQSWSGVYVGETLLEITSLVVDPKTPSTLYAAGDCCPGVGGVIKSTDGGQSWRPVNTGLIDHGSAYGGWLTIDPQTPSTLYVGASRGVFKTSNGGDSWHAAHIAIIGATAMVIDPRAATNIFAAVTKPTGALAPEQTGPSFDRSTEPPPSAARIYESVDGGDSWHSVSTTWWLTSPVRALVIDPQTSTTLFAAVAPIGVDREAKPGLFKSTDGGRTWRPLNTGLAGIVRALAVDPQRSNTVYAGISSGGVFKTIDGGERWHSVNAGLTGLDFGAGAIAIDPKTPTIVYASTIGGVFKSTDGGTSWRRPNIGLFGWVVTIAVDPETPTTIYAGAPSRGILKSTDGGGTWRAINAGLGDVTRFSVSALAIDPRTPSTLYMTWSDPNWGVPSEVYKSTDAGGSWTAINSGLPDRKMIRGLAIAPSAPATAYLNLGRIYRTTNGGGMWTPMGETYVAGYAIVVDPRAPDTIYVSGGDLVQTDGTVRGGGILKSIDGGRSWRGINTGLTNLHVHVIAIDPQTPTTLYIGTDAEYPGQPHGGVFVSTNSGESWHPMNDGLTSLRIFALAVDPKTSSTIYASTQDGVFVLRK